MVGLFDFLISLTSLLLWGIAVRVSGQRSHDRNNHTYRLEFPSELKPEQVITWLSALNGRLKTQWRGLAGVPTVIPEFWATSTGYQYRLRIPWQFAESVIDTLNLMCPGIIAIEEDNPEHDWTVAYELGESEPDRLFRLLDPADMYHNIIGSTQRLKDDEAVICQIVIAPTVVRDHEPPEKVQLPDWLIGLKIKPNKQADAEAKEKLAATNYAAVMRIGARADTRKRAKDLTDRLKGALISVNGSKNYLTRTRTPQGMVGPRIAEGKAMQFWPMRLTAIELATFMAWPTSEQDLPGVPRTHMRHLRIDRRIPDYGLVLARASHPYDDARPLALSPMDLMTHMHVLGKTGVGKSVVIENVATQLMRDGYGFICIEPSGDLTNRLLDLVPRERLNDVIYLDPLDTERPIGLNLMEGQSPSLIKSYLTGVCEAAFGTGILTSDILSNAIYTVALKGGMTLYEVALILDDPHFRDRMTRGLQDEQLNRFWTRYEGLSRGEQAQSTEPVMRRLRALLQPELRGIFGQTKGLDFNEVMRTNKIFIVNLAEGQIGEANAELLGSLIVARLWQAVQARSKLPESERNPYFLLADEFQRYVRLPTSFSEITNQARKYKLGCLFAHQHLGQISGVRDDVMTNARSKVILQAVSGDATAIAHELQIDAEDVKGLGKHQAILSLMHDGELLRPSTGFTSPPPLATGLGNAARAASRSQFGTPMHQVEEEMKSRRESPATNRRKPTIGRVDEQ